MSFDYLFALYVATILATRLGLWFWPKHSPKIGGFQMHHYMYGLALVALYLLIPNGILLAIGFALIADELPLFFIFKGWDWPDAHWKQYNSRGGLVVIVIISLCAYLVINH